MFKQDSIVTKGFQVKLLYDLEMQFIYSLLGDIMSSEIKTAIKIVFEHSQNVLSVWNVFIKQKEMVKMSLFVLLLYLFLPKCKH